MIFFENEKINKIIYRFFIFFSDFFFSGFLNSCFLSPNFLDLLLLLLDWCCAILLDPSPWPLWHSLCFSMRLSWSELPFRLFLISLSLWLTADFRVDMRNLLLVFFSGQGFQPEAPMTSALAAALTSSRFNSSMASLKTQIQTIYLHILPRFPLNSLPKLLISQFSLLLEHFVVLEVSHRVSNPNFLTIFQTKTKSLTFQPPAGS